MNYAALKPNTEAATAYGLQASKLPPEELQNAAHKRPNVREPNLSTEPMAKSSTPRPEK